MLVKDLIERYIVEVGSMPDKAFGTSHLYTLRRLQRMPIGAVVAKDLKASDLIAHARLRRQNVGDVKGVSAATVNQDITYLRGPFAYAPIGFDMPEISCKAFMDAKPLLTKFQLTGKSRPRDRRPSVDEYDRLIAYFVEQDTDSKIPMAVLTEFAVLSCRRISEICRLQWGDVDMENRTMLVRDMKDPRQKRGNHHRFALLGRAWDLVMQQPRLSTLPTERIFPYNSKSAGARYTIAKKRLGITNLRFHDNRREGASKLFEAGYGVPEVMVQTGHKNPQMLMRVYTKLSAADLHKGPASKAP